MKTTFQSLMIAAALFFPAVLRADPTDIPNVLALYDFNNLACNLDSNTPSYVSPCVCVTDLTLNGLCQSLLACGGPDGTAFRSFSGWDSAYDRTFTRSDFSPAACTLSYDVYVKNDDIANISGVSFDWQRPDCSSVDSIEATIFWQDSGGIQYCSTGPFALSGTGIWNFHKLDFPIDVTPLPTGTDTSGKQFHIELYAWGGSGGPLYLDNVALVGNCDVAPIPEPGGAIMIAAAGMMLLLRRRVRR